MGRGVVSRSVIALISQTLPVDIELATSDFAYGQINHCATDARYWLYTFLGSYAQ